MKTINKRIFLLVSVTVIFAAVAALLMFSMFSHAEEYALKSINSHLYDNGVLMNAGDIKDVNGTVLAQTVDGERVYSDDSDIRKAMLHIIGDNEGFISGGIQDTFREELCSYSLIFGVNKDSKNTLNLTLDSDLCAEAYNQLGSYKGCVGICNYKTGEIVCIATSPSYDMYNKPDDINDSDKYEGVYINRLFGGLYTPGSVFKIVTALGAINNIDDIFSQTFYCDGSYTTDDGEIICNDVHGTLTFEQALNYSCNSAFAQIAIQLGAEKLNEAFVQAGLDKKYSSIDRFTSKGGVFSAASTASSSDVGWAGIGQSTTLVNPYSYLNFMCAIANGGKSYLPYFVKSAEGENGREVYTAVPVDSGVSISPTTASSLKEMLRTTVSNYYGDYMFGDVTMCGKTGTAERDDGKPHAWFAGFSYDDSFPYAIITVVEDSGSGLKYAGTVAAHMMQSLYDKTVNK